MCQISLTSMPRSISASRSVWMSFTSWVMVIMIVPFSGREGQEIPALVVRVPAVHERVDAELVDGGIEDTVFRGELEDLEVGADRLRGERGRDVRDVVGHVAHVDEDEHTDHLGADTGQ